MSTSRHGAKSKCPDLTDSRVRLFACIKPLELDEHHCFCMFIIIIIIVSKILFPHALKCSFYAMMLKLINEFHAALRGNSLKMLRSSALIHCFSIVFHIKYEKIPQRDGGNYHAFLINLCAMFFPLHDGQKMNGLFVLRTGFFAPFACE